MGEFWYDYQWEVWFWLFGIDPTLYSIPLDRKRMIHYHHVACFAPIHSHQRSSDDVGREWSQWSENLSTVSEMFFFSKMTWLTFFSSLKSILKDSATLECSTNLFLLNQELIARSLCFQFCGSISERARELNARFQTQVIWQVIW